MSTSPDRTAPPFFPGLRLPERIVLAAWLALHASEFSRFEYNVRLGQGHDPGPGFSDTIRRMAVQNAQKKIDVVGYQAARATLIEVKERAVSGSIGQLLTYAHLWEQETTFTAAPLLKIIAARVSPGIIETAQKVGITVEIVVADFSSVTGAV